MDKKRKVAEVIVTVGNPPDKAITLEVRYDEGHPDRLKFGNWEETAYNACLHATRADMDSFELVFVMSPDESCWINVDVPPDLMKGGRVKGPVLLQVEKQLSRRGFECNYSSNGLWCIHRPDPQGGYAHRGYFDAAKLIRLATGDPGLVDEAVHGYWASRTETSSYGRYLNLRGGNMAKKAAADAAEEKVKEQVTVKALDGTSVAVSPKQKEIYDQIVARSASGSPVGSDEERLDDPSSIAAMKLATTVGPAVVRHKFGARWHYFAKQTDLDKAVAAAEKAAEAEKASKKKAAPAASTEEAAAGSGKKKGGPLKKPSEK
jgi:hypothetical protein